MDGDGVLIVVDTETTSKYPYLAKVLEVAAVVVRDGVVLEERFQTLSNPGLEALEGAGEAMRVNGITPEELAAAPPESEAKRLFAEFLGKWDGAALTSFNTGYDRPVLVGNQWLTSDSRWGFCIMLAAHDIMAKAGALPFERWKNDYKWPSLAQACAFFGVGAGNSHRALADAEAAAEIWLAVAAYRKGV